MKTPTIYLAGPEVFLENASRVLEEKRQICARLGLKGLAPVDNEALDSSMSDREKASAIYRGNIEVMKQADAIIANITPFRGPHMDPGTAFEVGFFAALGKPIICYTQTSDELVERVVDWSDHQITQGEDGVRDKNGHLIEDFGLSENLMIEASVDEAGHSVVLSTVRFGDLFACTDGFEEAARHMANYFKSTL